MGLRVSINTDAHIGKKEIQSKRTLGEGDCGAGRRGKSAAEPMGQGQKKFFEKNGKRWQEMKALEERRACV